MLRPIPLFVLVASVFGLAIALTLPVLGGYDESLHFLRAWQLSDGGIFAREGATEGRSAFGGDVPTELLDDMGALLRDGILSDDAGEIWTHVDDDAPHGPKQFVDFSSAAVYPPVPYLPSAVAIRVGRILGVSTFALVMLGRIANLAAFIALVALAVRRLTGRQWTLALLASLPVAVFQAATISADGITVALAFLVIADAIALTVRAPGSVERSLLVETAAATVALGLAKPPYVLVALLLVVPAVRHAGRPRVVLVSTLVAAALVAGLWSAYAADRNVPPNFAPAYLDQSGNYAYRDVDPDAQFEYVRGNALELLAAMGRTAAHDGDDIVRDALAQTAWWRIPLWLTLLAAAAVGAVAFLDASPPLARQLRAAGVAVAVALLLVISLLAYAGWNAVRAPRIDAFQGRYLFVAVAVLFVVVVPSRWARPSGADRLGVIVFGGLAGLLAVLVVGLGRVFYA